MSLKMTFSINNFQIRSNKSAILRDHEAQQRAYIIQSSPTAQISHYNIVSPIIHSHKMNKAGNFCQQDY